MTTKENNLEIKAFMLSIGEICFDNLPDLKQYHHTYNDNHHQNEWIFIKLNDTSRIRFTYNKDARLIITFAESDLVIKDRVNNDILATEIIVEEALVHAPEQLFLGLYEYCSVKCKFCPLAYNNEKVHYSLDSIFYDIDCNKDKDIQSIGITTAIPPNLEASDVGDELAFVIDKIIKRVGKDIPIGVSTKIPSLQTLKELKEAGACEIRLNMEVWDKELCKKMMPKKDIYAILESIQMASEVFGKGKVSSNLILGIGETDDSIIEGIEVLAKSGAIATLYPYDPIEQNCYNFARPNAERLIKLAKFHKEILKKYNLNPMGLRTMCPACAASHLYPGRDF